MSQVCMRPMAHGVCKGMVIRGEEIKAHTKRKRRTSGSDKEAFSDTEQHDERRGDASGDRSRRIGRSRSKDSKVARTETRSGSLVATGAARITRQLHAMRWAPSPRKRDAPAAARKDPLQKSAA